MKNSKSLRWLFSDIPKQPQKISVDEYKKTARRPPNLSEEFLRILKLIYPDLSVGMKEEYRFHPVRKWRFDFAWEEKKVAVECDGMAWQAGGGRHNTDSDRDKMNNAVVLGWRVFRFSGKQLRTETDKCFEFVKMALS